MNSHPHLTESHNGAITRPAPTSATEPDAIALPVPPMFKGSMNAMRHFRAVPSYSLNRIGQGMSLAARGVQP